MNEYNGNETQSSDFLRVLLALKDNIMRDTHCVEVCRVISVSESSIKCVLLNEQITISTICLQNINVLVDDIVLVVFADTSFRLNLDKIKNGQKTVATTTVTRHTLNNGIIIGLIYRNKQEN